MNPARQLGVPAVAAVLAAAAAEFHRGIHVGGEEASSRPERH